MICWGNNDFVRGDKVRTRMTLGLLRGVVYPCLQNIITLSEEDRTIVHGLFPKANVIYLPYMNDTLLKLDRKKSRGDKIRVMVSHSGWAENNHRRSFDALSRFKGLIEVICPLCYGDPEYIKETINYGKEIFGNDFYYFQDLMPLSAYMEFLRTIDVFMTAADRQTGLGAIFRSMPGGVKIYLTGNLLKSLKKDGYVVFDYDNILTENFEEFSKAITDESALHNVNLYNYTHCNGEPIINGWKHVYED